MSTLYNKSNPFLASIKSRHTLCQTGSKKDTQHIVLDIKGSGIHYQVGDSIAVFAKNDPGLVEKTLQAMHASGEETIIDKRDGSAWTLRDYLSTKANITDGNRNLLTEIRQRQTHVAKRAFVEDLFAESNRGQLKDYLEMRHTWDLLQEHAELEFSPQEICDTLLPLMPRFYSIASSREAVGEEVHLTVALLRYTANGHPRFGVCTHYLCNLAPLDEPVIPIYVQPHRGFTLPHNHEAPLIMVGPGTGVAPFRAFMQERALRSSPGKNWLFFGEWNRATDFYYESFWRELEREGRLRLEAAFSRDQEHKVYVQHRMKEHGKELFQWLEEGAHFFVCGDAQSMAKDVEATLRHIIQTHGNLDEAGAKHYLKRLQSEKRYLRDVY